MHSASGGVVEPGRGIEVPHFAEAVRAVVDAPRVGHEGADAEMQVGGFAFRIAAVAHAADAFAAGDPGAGGGVDGVEVGEIVHAPFGAQNHHELPSRPPLTRCHDHPAHRCDHRRAPLREHVHALVRDGLAPRVKPVRLAVVIVAGRAFDGHDEPFGNEEAEGGDGGSGQQDELDEFHEWRTGK